VAVIVAATAEPAAPAAASRSCVLGTALCAVGFNADGELGDGNQTSVSTFVSVIDQPSTPLRSLAAGYDHSVAVAANGSVWAWGNNGVGQLGTGTTKGSSKPVAVYGLAAGSGVTAVAASVQKPYSLALKANGAVLGWGDNSQGELGTSNYTGHLKPTAVRGLGAGSGVIAIAAGTESMALEADGTVLEWGGPANQTTPVQVPGLGVGSGVVAISSYGFSMALKSDGSVWAWGDNSFGQLGDGTTVSSATPVMVRGLGPGSGVIAIAAGELHGMALKSNGTVLAWGYGADGELGNGSGASSLVPEAVPGLGPGSGVLSIAAGGGDSFAITKSGALMAWGNNVYGELGDGTLADAYSPEDVGTVTHPALARVVAGYYHTLVAPIGSSLGCDPVWFIGARGSGEPASGYDGMGDVIGHLESVVAADLAAKGLAVAPNAVSYPADSVDVLEPDATVLKLLEQGAVAAALAEYIHSSVDKYDSSMDGGIKQAEADVAGVVRACPHARIVMAGYSQGAVAIHDAENWLAAHEPEEFSDVLATLLVGDPDRVPDSKAKLFGSMLQATEKGEGLRVYLHLVKAHDVPDPAATAEIANADDFVADFSLSDLTSSSFRKYAMIVHTSYAHIVKGRMTYEPVLADAPNWVAAKVHVSGRAVQ
jgi:alpha-tubulin suppressor-like RCC1 family protein